VATTLPRLEARLYGFGTYRAEDYDALIDHPVEMGRFTLAELEVCGVTHAVAVTGRQRAHMGRLCRDLAPICEHHIRLFGEPAPVQRYLFLITAVDEGYGGLEHRSSSALLCPRRDLPGSEGGPVEEDYRELLGLCSHEYFHTWNVKRIKPQAFIPYRLDREVHTRLLWVFEGITSYYDELALARSRVIEPQAYLELLARTITRVQRAPGRFKQSLSESSFDAWTKLYRQDENAPNAIVSYYAKGALVALALDLHLRLETDGRVSLDDFMRLLWKRFGRSGRGIGEDDVQALVEEVSGLSPGDFFSRYIDGLEDPPLAELLARFGVRMTLRPAESWDDKGGKPAALPLERLLRRGALGVRLDKSGGEARLAVVLDDSAARRAGLAAGDTICAVDGLRATAANLETLIGNYPPGSRLRIHAFRRDELREFEVELQVPAADTCVLTLEELDTADEVKRRRDAWLPGPTTASPPAGGEEPS
jgi:predicted metalloprotease with PDZ domain